MIGARTTESLSKVAPRIFSLKREVQKLKRDKVSCSEKIPDDDEKEETAEKITKLLNLEEAEEKVQNSNSGNQEQNMREPTLLNRTENTTPSVKHIEKQVAPTNQPAVTENPVLKSRIFSKKIGNNKLFEYPTTHLDTKKIRRTMVKQEENQRIKQPFTKDNWKKRNKIHGQFHVKGRTSNVANRREFTPFFSQQKASDRRDFLQVPRNENSGRSAKSNFPIHNQKFTPYRPYQYW